uniref:Uncharacterized protein n=1 Tax=Fagus sylvatica TaxID=28930 RepID=A0A2N9EEE4_FAGSY
MYRCRFDDGTVCFIIVDAWLLMKAFGHEAGFISFDGTISMTLDSEHPFAPNNILIRVWRNKSPSLILEKSIKLNVHCILPLGVLGGNGEAGGFGVKRGLSGGGKQRLREGISDGAICGDFRFCDVIFGAGLHMVM